MSFSEEQRMIEHQGFISISSLFLSALVGFGGIGSLAYMYNQDKLVRPNTIVEAHQDDPEVIPTSIVTGAPTPTPVVVNDTPTPTPVVTTTPAPTIGISRRGNDDENEHEQEEVHESDNAEVHEQSGLPKRGENRENDKPVVKTNNGKPHENQLSFILSFLNKIVNGQTE